MAEAVHQRDQADAVLAADLGELPGLLFVEAPGFQLGVRLELEAVIDLQNEHVEPQRGEPFGDEPFRGVEPVGLEPDQVIGDPPLVLGLPLLAPRLAGRLRSERQRGGKKHNQAQDSSSHSFHASLLPLHLLLMHPFENARFERTELHGDRPPKHHDKARPGRCNQPGRLPSLDNATLQESLAKS